ncbi:MAG: phage/plasmid primase, P4 family [Desulfosporosinus sp.]|nr:phage/plasmid primase, P4 family [Desulfosporosinus sp.]
MNLKYDGSLTIATGNSRKDKKWVPKEILWSELLSRVQTTQRTAETVAEYRKMSKDEQDARKDVGGFVGGKLKGGRRKKGFVEYRSVVALDGDYAKLNMWSDILMFNGYACCIYSTHKHAPDAPRFRLLIPLMRRVTPDEYQAIARKIADDLGIEQFDDTTYSPERLMYWPSTSSDGEFIFEYQDGPWLNPDEVLARYEDWTDTSSWPVSSRQKEIVKKTVAKQADPTGKEGIVGAFCRTYSITEALETFLSDVYESCDIEDRYTYTGGSTSGGLVTYKDLYAYSHHATDPASSKLCNAFDLVRLHKFGELDKDAEDGTQTTKLPSFKAMMDFARNDAGVQEFEREERIEAAKVDFRSEKVNPKKIFFKEERFIPAYMAEWFLQRHHAFVMNEDVYLYKNGVYVKDERTFKNEATTALGLEFQSSRVREAMDYIKNTIPLILAEEAVETGSLLNLKNGLLDLETLELKPHTPECRTTLQLPVVYDLDADTLPIDTFLKKVMPHDAIPVLEEYVGYCFLATMRYDGSLILQGEGGNGKGTLIAVISEMLGKKNVSNVSFQALTDNRFAVAQLFGKLANLHADIPNKTLENTDVFKQVTSGDMMQAEQKHKDPFSFRNRAKLIYSANEPPLSKDNTEGFHRRLLLIPFPTKFRDRRLRESLFKAEALSGFLLRALQGMQRLVVQGDFSSSETIAAARAEYRIASDTVAHFLDEYCSFDTVEMVGKQDLYDAFRNVCAQWGNHPLSQTKFNARLKALHPELTEYHQKGPRYWKGINLEINDF